MSQSLVKPLCHKGWQTTNAQEKCYSGVSLTDSQSKWADGQIRSRQIRVQVPNRQTKQCWNATCKMLLLSLASEMPMLSSWVVLNCLHFHIALITVWWSELAQLNWFQGMSRQNNLLIRQRLNVQQPLYSFLIRASVWRIVLVTVLSNN